MAKSKKIRLQHLGKTAQYALITAVVSAVLVGCDSNSDGVFSDNTLSDDNTEPPVNQAAVPDNDSSELFGDWSAGCVAHFDNNNQLIEHRLLTTSIDQLTWTDSIDRYAIEDTECDTVLGTTVYAYQIEILATGTVATIDGEFFGNATNFDISDTIEDAFGDADYDDRGSGLGIWLVKDDRLYSNITFDQTRPVELLNTFNYTRL